MNKILSFKIKEMFELLRILKEYEKELEEKTKAIEEMSKCDRNDDNFWFCKVYDNGGLELIEELKRFLLAFFTAIEIKGLTIYRSRKIAAFLKEARKMGKEIEKLCNKAKKQKEQEDVDKSPYKPRDIWIEKRIKRVLDFYRSTTDIFKDWNAYPFGLVLGFKVALES